jgi:hypothetical protein
MRGATLIALYEAIRHLITHFGGRAIIHPYQPVHSSEINVEEINLSDQRPFTYQFLIERWADGLKVLGAGNGAGLLASGASLQFFAAKPELLSSIKVAAGFFLAGILLFAVAFLILTALPLSIESFLASSNKTYRVFKDMMGDVIAYSKEGGRLYIALILTSLLSFLCFMVDCLYGVLHVILFV